MAYIWLDLVTTTFLGNVKTTVCQINEAIDLIRFCGIDGDALADSGNRDCPLLAVFNPYSRQRLTNAFRDLQRLPTSGSRQGNNKFFAAPSSNCIRLLDVMLDGCAKRFENTVSHKMPVGVVILLEKINV
jgi:hypothetical protein